MGQSTWGNLSLTKHEFSLRFTRPDWRRVLQQCARNSYSDRRKRCRRRCGGISFSVQNYHQGGDFHFHFDLYDDHQPLEQLLYECWSLDHLQLQEEESAGRVGRGKTNLFPQWT